MRKCLRALDTVTTIQKDLKVGALKNSLNAVHVPLVTPARVRMSPSSEEGGSGAKWHASGFFG